MNFKQYITLMAVGSGMAWITWGFILLSINPNEAGIGAFFLFYSALLVALAGSMSIAGFIIRVWVFKKNENISILAGRSFRHALLISILLIGMLFFQSKGILNWWIIIFFLAILTFLEFFIISYKKRK